LGLLILRLGAGGLMLTHGYGKLQMLRAGKFADFPDPIGIGSTASLWLIVLAEFVCPILVMAGFLTRLSALPVVIAMCVAGFVVHAADPLATKELSLLYATSYLALLFTGAGCISVDGLMWGRKKKAAATA
jgi:putative oxidoreductase